MSTLLDLIKEIFVTPLGRWGVYFHSFLLPSLDTIVLFAPPKQKKNGYQQDVQSKVSDIVLGKEKPVEESNPEYEKLKHYIFELENHLTEAQKHAYRLVKRHRGI